MNKLYVNLGCFGRVDNGFISCAGIENAILNVHERVDHYNDMMDYFDNCRLFDKPLFEYSAIRNFLHNMNEKFDQPSIGRPLWTPKEYHLFESFVVNHRNCGTYIKLSLEKKDIKIEEKSVPITATSKKTVEAPRVNLKLLRR